MTIPTITRILFATALSERSATTLRHVIGLAAAEARRILAERQDRCWFALDPEEQKVRAQVVATDVKEGFPAEVIIRDAAEHGCDLIVIGTHEQALTHSYLGTIAKRVLRHAPVPTLIVPFHEAR